MLEDDEGGKYQAFEISQMAQEPLRTRIKTQGNKDPIKIPRKTREDFLLLTTRRRKDDYLFNHSENLSRPSRSPDIPQPEFKLLQDVKHSKELSKELGEIPTFDLKMPCEKQMEIEVPHFYMRPHVNELYF